MPTQTFLDLYRELKARRYRKQDIELIFRAHELAAQIFSSSYRPTYKPFICHLVGTASVLGRCEERAEVIAAAILHSVYPHGTFGDGTRGITEQKRRVVSQCVGGEVEELVYQYCVADWTRFENHDDTVTPQGVERDLWAMKLADLFDDFSDNTMKIAPEKGMVMHPLRDEGARATLLNRASRTLGPVMATEFEALFDSVAQEEIDDFLVNEQTASFVESRKPLTPPARTFRVTVSRQIKGFLRRTAL